jgi:hypothetical protein
MLLLALFEQYSIEPVLYVFWEDHVGEACVWVSGAQQSRELPLRLNQGDWAAGPCHRWGFRFCCVDQLLELLGNFAMPLSSLKGSKLQCGSEEAVLVTSNVAFQQG